MAVQIYEEIKEIKVQVSEPEIIGSP